MWSQNHLIPHPKIHISPHPCAGTFLLPAHSISTGCITPAIKNTPYNPNMPSSSILAEFPPWSPRNLIGAPHCSAPGTKITNDYSVQSPMSHNSDISLAPAAVTVPISPTLTLLVASTSPLVGPRPFIAGVASRSPVSPRPALSVLPFLLMLPPLLRLLVLSLLLLLLLLLHLHSITHVAPLFPLLTLLSLPAIQILPQHYPPTFPIQPYQSLY
jgi:hypothetical protein